MPHPILLLGNNDLTIHIADDLMNAGYDLLLASPDGDIPGLNTKIFGSGSKATIEVLTNTTVSACRGTMDDFNIQLAVGGIPESRHVSQIIICENDQRQTDYAVHGLQPSEVVVSLSQLQNHVDQDDNLRLIPTEITRVIFLIGLKRESTPDVTGRAMESALKLQKSGKKVYLLTGNLKVADHGLESLYHQATEAGVIVIKFNKTRPAIQTGAQGQVLIEFEDELAARRFRLTPDLTVLDEIRTPSQYLDQLIQIFELETDLNGYAQGDNVHRAVVLTNRKGILVAGPSRNIATWREQSLDAGSAALTLLSGFGQENLTPASYATINNGRCIHCLTCHRLCPYRAITISSRVYVQPNACEACGICKAECPREAIELTGLDRAVDSPSQGAQSIGSQSTPLIMVFSCGRSAMPASRLAEVMGHTLPMGAKVIQVPCAGSLSADDLLTAFQNGADGVLLLTCHIDNCHSSHGNRFARERANIIQTRFEQIGFESERIRIQTLAANMGTAFAEILNDFEKMLVDLGPSRLK